MEKKELKGVIDRILTEKIQVLLNRIDSFQNHIIKEIENLKRIDDVMQFEIPADLLLAEARSEEAEIQLLNDYVKKISSATTQQSLISSILEGVNCFCSRAALFLLRDDKLTGWKGKGFSGTNDEINDEELNKIFFSLSANTVFKQVLESKKPYAGDPVSKPDDFLIYNRFGGKQPEKILVLPFFVKGKPQAIIYCDASRGKAIKQKNVEIVSLVGELSLDLLPLRQKIMTRVKTQEFIGPAETGERIESKHMELIDEMEKTATTTMRENDPERLARVIVNDVILYNQKVVEDGIRNKNLYEVLKDTLVQAKEMYMRKAHDVKYFEAQLIHTLARGDKTALKGYNFEVFK